MRRVVWASDFHLGLQTDDMDRTDEIMEIIRFVFKHAVKIKADFIILGGDIFDNNTPNEKLIALFISTLNIIGKIPMIVMVGNHDSIAGHKRRSCLSFIKELKAYPNIKVVDDIQSSKYIDNIYFTFLPFIAKSHLKPAYSSVQQYVNVKAKEIRRKMPKDAQHFVFSHLMPPDCIPGTEQWMLKKVDVVVPKAFLVFKHSKFNQPTIINGHVHSRQQVGNIEVVGSQLFTAFGEKEKKKFFLQLNISDSTDEVSGGLKFIETPCKKLIEINVELTKQVLPREVVAAVLSNSFSNSIVKVNLTLHPSAVGFDVQTLHEQLSILAYYVKPIHPRILRRRIKRNKRQTIRLSPHSGVKEWLKKNKPKNPKWLLKLADEYIERVL